MNVLEIGTNGAVARSNALFLDVGVEGVKENADIRMADLLGKRRSIGGGVQKIGFEPVQRFNGENHTMGGQRVTQGLKALDGPFPLIAGPPPAWQVADRAVERSGDNPDARVR